MSWCRAGINCGVLLIRSTEWARTFFADVGQYSYMDKATLDRNVRPVRPALCSPSMSPACPSHI